MVLLAAVQRRPTGCVQRPSVHRQVVDVQLDPRRVRRRLAGQRRMHELRQSDRDGILNAPNLPLPPPSPLRRSEGVIIEGICISLGVWVR